MRIAKKPASSARLHCFNSGVIWGMHLGKVKRRCIDLARNMPDRGLGDQPAHVRRVLLGGSGAESSALVNAFEDTQVPVGTVAPKAGAVLVDRLADLAEVDTKQPGRLF